MSYLTFKEVPYTGKTKRWEVYSRKTHKILGRISWESHWRQYIFGPAFPTIWEEDCLREIADFIEAQTKEHKDASRT